MTDRVGALQQLAGEVLRLKDILAERVAELQSWRYESRLGAEQLRSELLLLERAQDRAGRLLTDLAKLNLDERAVKINQGQAAIIGEVLLRALAAVGMQDHLELRRALAEELLAVDEAGPTGSRSTSGGSRRALAQPGAWR